MTHYLEIHGMAMGPRMVPSYANIFEGDLEMKILAQVYKRSDIWWRYIDHIFTIWSHDEEHLIDFVEQINNTH